MFEPPPGWWVRDSAVTSCARNQSGSCGYTWWGSILSVFLFILQENEVNVVRGYPAVYKNLVCAVARKMSAIIVPDATCKFQYFVIKVTDNPPPKPLFNMADARKRFPGCAVQCLIPPPLYDAPVT